MLIFFDWPSVAQEPRTRQESLEFRDALTHLGTLYSCFDVLVIDFIPPSFSTHGHHVPYLEKGWCWSEANVANILF